MSESKAIFKAPRTVPEIQQEYQALCTKAGHCQYQLYTLQKDLDMFNSTLRDLNAEAIAATNAANKAAIAAEPAKEEQANA